MAELKKHVGLKADEEEIAQIELIKKHYGLKQDGAVIRFVVNQEAKKIGMKPKQGKNKKPL